MQNLEWVFIPKYHHTQKYADNLTYYISKTSNAHLSWREGFPTGGRGENTHTPTVTFFFHFRKEIVRFSTVLRSTNISANQQLRKRVCIDLYAHLVLHVNSNRQ